MLRLAWRNLWRNRTRTVIALLAITLSYALMLVSMGLQDASYDKMEAAALRSAGGSILIHGEGYWLDQAADQLVTSPEPILQELAQVAEVTAVIPRVIINGLVASPRGSSGVRLTGIDPEAEAELADLSRYLRAGEFLDGEAAHPLVLGSGIVDELAIELGDRVVLTATDPRGEVVRALFHLTGILHSGTQAFDSVMAYTTIDAAREAVGMGPELTQIGLLVEDDRRRQRVRDAVAARLAETDGLEVMTWDEAVPEMIGLIEIDAALDTIFVIIIFVVVGFGIANTFLMSVMERVRELGLLAALGMTPGRTLRMVLSEAFLLAVVALAVGFALGYSGHLYLSIVGIDLQEVWNIDVEMAGITLEDTHLRSQLRPLKWLTGTLAVFALVILTSLYPASRAVRLDPAQAMRTYE